VIRATWIAAAALAAAGIAAFAFLSSTDVVAESKVPSIRKPFGLEQRELWTTSHVKGSPEPPAPYQMVRTFPKLKFNEALEIAPVPGRKAWIVAERPGAIYTFDADPARAEKKLVIDVGHTIYGAVLHPQFETNGYLYVTSVPDPKNVTDDGTRIVRYTIDPETMTGDTKSAKILLTYANGGHNGTCLRFGPDGFLYLSTGDASGIADSRQTGQDISDLYGSILRIDVDHESGGKPYSIPKDNPFANTKGARPEVYAYGIRQAWKISHDTATGQLWAGEVGQNLYEEINLIKKGGNYGWNAREALHPFGGRGSGPKPEFIEPIWEYHHEVGRSITGGGVYNGKKHPELVGHYLYADYTSSKIWALKYDAKEGRVTANRPIPDKSRPVISFGEDEKGEMYLLTVAADGKGIFGLAK